VHHAGACGTTLSKRVLWDLKSDYPCCRLLKYNVNTSELITELFQRTGKTVIMSVEVGSTVISETDLKKLTHSVDSANCKLVILKVERNKSNSNKTVLEEKIFPAFTISDMEQEIAVEFKNKFAQLTSVAERHRKLEQITADNNYIEQKSPFFYGFYTYQEEYNLGNVFRTVEECDFEEKRLLSDLALITIFSQNVCVSFYEICERLHMDKEKTLVEHFPSAILKLIVDNDKGFRICHPIIAKRVIEQIYRNDSANANLDFKAFVYVATKSYIENISQLYGNNDKTVDENLKELLIDRSYIDIEERKSKFSDLIENIPNRTEQEELFKLLIERFPDNPHYYNHLARLCASYSLDKSIVPSFEQAIYYAKKAVDIAEKSGTDISTHYTTLGCIYSRSILHYLTTEAKDVSNNRIKHRYIADNSETYPRLISKIASPCLLAEESFYNARKYNKTDDTFNFFPQINMELSIIDLLRQCSKSDNMNTKELVNTNQTFGEWYYEHHSTATELFISMRKFTDDKDSFVKTAKQKFSSVAIEYDDKYLTNELRILSNNSITSEQKNLGDLFVIQFIITSILGKELKTRP
jgi:hypothetical protein